MLLRKWNYEKHEYEPYNVPDKWDCRYYWFDMTEIINCCQCGGKVTFGECYSSQEIHTSVGFGYMVCEECHNIEMERRTDKKEDN